MHYLTELGCSAIRCRASFYADDLVLFIVPNAHDLLVLKTILDLFGAALGLFSNLEKSVATPICCSDLTNNCFWFWVPSLAVSRISRVAS
jgi:hypothetical protein